MHYSVHRMIASTTYRKGRDNNVSGCHHGAESMCRTREKVDQLLASPYPIKRSDVLPSPIGKDVNITADKRQFHEIPP